MGAGHSQSVAVQRVFKYIRATGMDLGTLLNI